MIAALYVDPRGPYAHMPDVDPWPAARDARAYRGPHPVVAHPPCGAWSRLRHLSHGHGADCGPIAVRQAQCHGGVLEQPAHSTLWAHCGLPQPGRCDAHGFTIEVCQVAWGHVARKRTWLYCVGVPQWLAMVTRRKRGTPTHWCSGTYSAGARGCVPDGIRVCTTSQRNLTPPAFAQWLVFLARSTAL